MVGKTLPHLIYQSIDVTDQEKEEVLRVKGSKKGFVQWLGDSLVLENSQMQDFKI